MGLVFPGSNSAIQSPSGIQWLIEYNPSTLAYKINNKSHPTIVFGHYNMKPRSHIWPTGVQAVGISSDTWLEMSELTGTELTIEPVPGTVGDTFYIKRGWSTSPSGEERPQYIAIATDWSNTPTEPAPHSDEWGNEDAIQWFNMHGSSYDELPVYHWVGLEQFIIRPYDPSIDPVETNDLASILSIDPVVM